MDENQEEEESIIHLTDKDVRFLKNLQDTFTSYVEAHYGIDLEKENWTLDIDRGVLTRD